MKAGRYDAALRRRAKRAGRERGCWIYIAAEELERAGIDPHGPAPWYRVTGTQTRGARAMVNLYREG